jgi:hypothetical protein
MPQALEVKAFYCQDLALANLSKFEMCKCHTQTVLMIKRISVCMTTGQSCNDLNLHTKISIIEDEMQTSANWSPCSTQWVRT